MDNKKDNQETKGQQDSGLKDNNYLALSHFNIGHLVNKAQKVCSAIYLLTEHIETNDPIRGRTRECAVFVLRDTYSSLHSSDHKDKKNRLSKIKQTVEEMSVLFEIMSLSMMVSQNNYEVMKREISKFKEMIYNSTSLLENHIVFPSKLFLEELEANQPINEELPLETNDKKLGAVSREVSRDIHKRQNNNVLYKTDTASKENGNRRDLILKLIRKNKDLGIKDIHNSFTGVSEKTIQRELTKMVGNGDIVRKGDKRWSRYSIA